MADAGPPPLEDVDIPAAAPSIVRTAVTASNADVDVSYARSGTSAAVGSPDDVDDLMQEMQAAAIADSAARAAAAAARDAADASTSFSAKSGGLKRGFLLPSAAPSPAAAPAPSSSGTRATAAAAAASSDDVIRPTAPAASKADRLRLPEVQASTATGLAQALGDKAAWMTPDLFKRIMEDPMLVKGMSDARFMKALDEFQKDAAGAMRKYKDAMDVQEFMRRFMGVMGEHFATLSAEKNDAEPSTAGMKETSSRTIAAAASSGAKSSTAAAAARGGKSGAMAPESIAAAAKAVAEGRVQADAEVKAVLSDTQVVQLMQDPVVQRVLAECQRDPGRLRYFMSFPDVRAKLMMMQRAGLIRFE